METASWVERIIAAIRDIADRDFQQRAWLGAGPELASFVETYCTLYDQAFETFLSQAEWEQTGLSNAVRQEMILLDHLLQAYHEPELDAEVLADPKWLEVVQQAQRVVQVINESQ